MYKTTGSGAFETLPLCCSKQDYLVLHSHNMILNLSKPFHFSRDKNEYKGMYIFKSNKGQDGTNDVRLVLNVSENEQEEKLYEINKPTAVLFQSNDLIEEMIANEVVGFYDYLQSLTLK